MSIVDATMSLLRSSVHTVATNERSIFSSVTGRSRR